MQNFHVARPSLCFRITRWERTCNFFFFFFYEKKTFFTSRIIQVSVVNYVHAVFRNGFFLMIESRSYFHTCMQHTCRCIESWGSILLWGTQDVFVIALWICTTSSCPSISQVWNGNWYILRKHDTLFFGGNFGS